MKSKAYFEICAERVAQTGILTGPKSYFEIKVSGCNLTSYEVHFVSLAGSFTVQLSNLLKLPSGNYQEPPVKSPRPYSYPP